MAKEVRTEVEIGADARRVWDVIADFPAYPEWNPFIRRIDGEARAGSRITVHITTPGGTRRTYEPVITVMEPAKELRWVGKVPGIVSGEHIFELVPSGGGGRTRLVHREVFGGLLSPFFGRRTEDDILAGFEQMNAALKKRAESPT